MGIIQSLAVADHAIGTVLRLHVVCLSVQNVLWLNGVS